MKINLKNYRGIQESVNGEKYKICKANFDVGAGPVSARKENRGITLIALIITIIIMLILVAVSVRILIDSNLIGIAEETADKTKTAYEKESNLSEITVGDKPYNSINEYISQMQCSHEWGEWVENAEERLKTRTCKNCGATEIKEMLVIGAYIEGYNPSIAEDGSAISTKYTSAGAQSGGTETTDGTSGNGHSDQSFTVGSITKWRILGEENGQVIITTADPIQTDETADYYLRGQAGYANMIDELNKISGIYGQGKYADTSKYSYTIDGTTIASGGRSIKLEDLNCTVNEPTTETYTKNAEDGYIYTDGRKTTHKVFNYWGEDAEPSEGAGWKTLGSGESVTIAYYGYTKGTWTTKQQEMIYKNSAGSNASYWLASRYPFHDYDYYYVNYYARYVTGGYIGNYELCRSRSDYAYDIKHDVRPAVYLESEIQLKYNSETNTYTIK